MTREECESKICEHLREIRDIYHEYAPEGHHLQINVFDDLCGACNEYWKRDAEYPIEIFHHFEEDEE